MKLFNSFIHGNDLAEILIAGVNPYGLKLLDDRDIDAVRGQLAIDEKLNAYLCGRVVEAGRGVWYLTSAGVILQAGDGKPGTAIRLTFSDIEAAEAQKGKYGDTVRLQAAGRRFALYGVSQVLAIAFMRMLAAAGPGVVRADARSLSPVEALRAIHCQSDAARRAQPLAQDGPMSAPQVLGLVQQARELGMIGALEEAALREEISRELTAEAA